MSQRAARWAVAFIAVTAAGMMLYVTLRVHLFNLSYEIERDEEALTNSQEHVRTLRYEVAQMKSLGKLSHLTSELSVPMSHPVHVNLIPEPTVDLDTEKLLPRPFPQKMFPSFSLVPEALAETGKRK